MMQFSQRSQRTSLVPFFKLVYWVMKIKMAVNYTLERCGTLVVGKALKDVFSGRGQEFIPVIFRPFQSPLVLTNEYDN